MTPSVAGKTPRGYTKILTITDAWSNYLVALPCRGETAQETASLIQKYWVEKYGPPAEILSDNAPGYSSKLFNSILRLLDIKTTKGRPYTARTSGRAEASNRRMNQALRVCIPDGKYNNWDLYLGKITFALNCLRNRHTGFSPNYLVHHQEMNVPLSVLAVNRDDFEIQPVKQLDSVDAWEMYNSFRKVVREVRNNAQSDFLHSQKYYEKNMNNPSLDVGSEVLVLIRCPVHKFQPRWAGPFPIVKKISDHLYVIKTNNGDEKVVNMHKLKPYKRNRFSEPITQPPVTTKLDKTVDPPPPRTRLQDSSSSDSSGDEEAGRHLQMNTCQASKTLLSPQIRHYSTTPRSELHVPMRGSNIPLTVTESIKRARIPVDNTNTSAVTDDLVDLSPTFSPTNPFFPTSPSSSLDADLSHTLSAVPPQKYILAEKSSFSPAPPLPLPTP